MAFFRTALGSWVLLGLAVCAWVGVAFFAWTIEGEKEVFAQSQTGTRALEDKHTTESRMMSLSRETKGDRAHIESTAHVDVVSMVDAIDMVGKDAGVYIQIGQATPDTGKSAVRGVTFQLDAQGSFDSLMRAASLFQTLPIPTSLETAQFSHTGGGGTSPGDWHMSARVRIFTTADI